MTLCDTFKFGAQRTWKRIEKASQYRLLMGEESITDDLLLEIRDRHPNEVAICQFNKVIEGRNGADWEWWFTDGTYWFGTLVQAKRVFVRPPSRRSRERIKIHFSKRQHRRLLAAAAKKNVSPIYVFYSHFPKLSYSTITWNCNGQHTGNEIDLFGCAIADAYTLARTKITTISSFTSNVLPWSCAVCCTGKQTSGSKRNVPHQIFFALSSMRVSETDLAAEAPHLPEPRQEAPAYVHIALKAETDADLRRAAKLAGRTRGVVVFGQTGRIPFE